jgi:hypothetical protein
MLLRRSMLLLQAEAAQRAMRVARLRAAQAAVRRGATGELA